MATKRAARRAEQTEAFLDAALKIVARHGIEGLTIAALADDVGAAAGAHYRYFPGKSDLLAALQVRALDKLAAELAAAASDRRSELRRVVDVVAVVATLPDRDPPRARLLDELLSAPAPIYDATRARVLEAQLARVFALVERALEEAVRAGALSPGDGALRTRVLWALVHGASHLKKRDRLEPPARRHRRVERAALEAVLVGFGADLPLVRAALRASSLGT